MKFCCDANNDDWVLYKVTATAAPSSWVTVPARIGWKQSEMALEIFNAAIGARYKPKGRGWELVCDWNEEVCKPASAGFYVDGLTCGFDKKGGKFIVLSAQSNPGTLPIHPTPSSPSRPETVYSDSDSSCNEAEPSTHAASQVFTTSIGPATAVMYQCQLSIID